MSGRVLEPVLAARYIRGCSETRQVGGSGALALRQVPAVPSWAILVRKSVVVVDGVEGLAEMVGERVGGGRRTVALWPARVLER